MTRANVRWVDYEHKFRCRTSGSRVHPVIGDDGFGAQGDQQVALSVPESPIRQSGSPFLTQSQVARVWMTAGST